MINKLLLLFIISFGFLDAKPSAIWQLKKIKSESIKTEKLDELQSILEKHFLELNQQKILVSDVISTQLKEDALSAMQCDSNCLEVNHERFIPTHNFEVSVERVGKKNYTTFNLRDLQTYSIIKTKSFSNESSYNDFLIQDLKNWIEDFNESESIYSLNDTIHVDLKSAVLPLKGVNIEAGFGSVMSNRLTSELFKTKK